MKNIFKYIAVVAAAGSLTACVSLLDQEPLDSYTDAAVFGDLALSETYLNDQYNYIWPEVSRNARFSCFSDELYHKHGYGTINTTHCNATPDSPYIYYYEECYRPWVNYYSYISKINLFLEKIDGVPATTDEDKEWRNEQKGQALFLRAYNYSMLYAFFGRCCIIDHTFDLNADFNEERQDADKVADFIVKDCDDAAALLPVEYADASDFSRATKGAALALKTRVLITKASPLYGTPSRDKWQAVADAAKAVMDLNKYSLRPVANSDEYAELFLDSTNPEAIFERVFDGSTYDWGTSTSNPMGQIHAVPPGPGSGFEGWGTLDPTQNVVDKIQMADGTAPAHTAAKDPETDENPWVGREIRFYADFLYDGSIWGYGADRREVETYLGSEESVADGQDSSGGPYWWNASNTGYSLRKGMDPDWDSYGNYQMDIPWMFIRYAEILLDYAEAQIELGNDTEAARYINMVRNRALLPDLTGDVRKAYEYERQIEFVFEGQRWFDMRRWKRMDEEYATPVYGYTVTKYPDGHKHYKLNNEVDQREWKGDKYYWVPVPRTENQKSPLIDLQPYE